MLKRNIKIILVGFFSLILMLLAYTMLGNSPEIISDESLRVEEPAEPKMKAEVSTGALFTETVLSDRQIESSLEAKLIDQPVASYREELKETAVNSTEESDESVSKKTTSLSILENSDTKIVVSDLQSENEVNILIEEEQPASPFQDELVQRFEVDSKRIKVSDGAPVLDETRSDIKASESYANVSEDAAFEMFEQESDVEIISDSSEFLDLNLTDPEPALEMVLVEGDQLIIDDVNEVLVESQIDQSETASEDVTFESVASAKPSSIVVPEVDEALMKGDSEISKQYRATMSKLISINAKLRTADEENIQLQRQFEMSVQNNRQLAQIIRDIDDRIKALTSTN